MTRSRAFQPILRQIGDLCHFGPLHRFLKIELPFAAQGLVYNCMVPMAGGWVFLTINEAFTLGDRNFQLPGLGSIMSLAIARGDVPAQIAAVVAMGLMIISMDRLVWWPLVIWSRKFKIEDVASGPLETTFVQRTLTAPGSPAYSRPPGLLVGTSYCWSCTHTSSLSASCASGPETPANDPLFSRPLCGPHFGRLRLVWPVFLIAEVDFHEWLLILSSAAATFLRVFAALAISSLWTIPVGRLDRLEPTHLPFPATDHSVCGVLSCPDALSSGFWLVFLPWMEIWDGGRSF